ncbi:MAG TPA: hypothetical protein VGV37_01465 [Aliidongia sp.]|uniref:hypothetical protein n=1 Tax=Aliidongia sp. TaxID=1914230 RepID=UPI002DDD77AA|nr:hypothetical protein [Aliidongia sp.]HEV2673177.1 hypothetical protein [Aliidongia sp.]
MPRELRQIMFGPPEIMTAIMEYHRRRSLTLPRGTAVRCQILDEPTLSAIMFIQTDGLAMTELSVDAETLAAALILYCINRKIPLPAEAEKRLRKLGDDRVALFMIKPPR